MGSQVYFYLLVFIVTMLVKCLWNVVLLSSQVIDANGNFRFMKKKLKGDNSNPLWNQNHDWR